MRKILSVTLAVVMLAALVTVFPVSAATVDVPQILLTEICQDTTGWSNNGSDTADTYEFIELYNAGLTEIDLYDYAMVISPKNDDFIGKDPSGTKFDRVDPIVQKGKSQYNTAGTISTANYAENPYNLYPVNPETAKVAPGKTAVVWFYGGDAMKSAAAKGSAITIEEFRDYFHMSDDIVVVAVDANGNAKDATTTGIYSPTAKLEDTFNVAGVPDADSDAYGYSKRFNLYNSEYRLYGIIALNVIDNYLDDSDNNKVTDLTLGPTSDPSIPSCISFAGCNQSSADAKKSLTYKAANEATGAKGAGSLADVTWNFIVSNKKVDLCYDGTAKAAGLVKYMGLDRMNYATPGLLLPSQVANLKLANVTTYDLNANFTEPDDSVKYSRYIKTVDKYSAVTARVSYTPYLENFFGMADSTDSDAIINALGWNRSTYLNNGGTAKLSIVNGQLVCDNLGAESLDSIFTIAPSDLIATVAYDNYSIEYQITYLDANSSDRYAAVVYNFNEACAYDIFILRVGGWGNNQRRIGGSSYATYDNNTVTNYAANGDTSDKLTSILAKISNYSEKLTTTTGTDMSSFTDAQKATTAPLLNRPLNVKIEVDQVAGPKLYINGILVSEACTKSGVALSPYWGIQNDAGEFSIGLFVSQKVKCVIDNIKVNGFTENYLSDDVNDKLEDSAEANLVEPATGDATIYVAVAMAVSFISLAALVVVKRRKNEN